MIGFYDYTVLATYAATALGVTGMFQAVEGRHLTAVFCLLAAGLLDCFDGRIARTKKDRSHQQQSFGIQIDSLNDVLCFGALPSVAGYCAWSRWSDAPTPVWYGAALCVFTLAGLIRLAYFNVTEEERQQTEGGGRKYYLGLPITASALVFPLFYLLGLLLPGGPYILAAGMLLLAALRFGAVKLEQVRTAALFLTGIFPLLFVPAAAGVMDLWADLQAMLVPVLLALIPITILVMTVSGCVTQRLAERKEKKQ